MRPLVTQIFPQENFEACMENMNLPSKTAKNKGADLTFISFEMRS